MDGISMDHYEKRLYTVFKTFDVDNEEALDRSAVLDLCNALQLEDKGSALVNALFERPADRITFTQFRNGLLTVLGGGGGDATTASTAPTAHSDDDSSGREVAPKFVYGSKKYGRRSKPQTVCSPPRNVELNQICAMSREHCAVGESTTTDIEGKRSKDSLMDDLNKNTLNGSTHCDLDHDRLIDYEESLALCHSLHMDKMDRHIIEQIFKDAAASASLNKITVGEFFHRLNSSLTVSIASTCDNDVILSNVHVMNEPSESDTGTIGIASVVEIWEKSGIEHGKRLLQELGFTSPVIRLAEITSALEEELRILTLEHAPMDARALLLQASIALHRFQVARTKQTMEQIIAENGKLKNDLTDANRRAQVLAQEVDENHTRMESSLKAKIKQLEAKHAENMKIATNEWAAEKEKVSGIMLQLETTTTRLSVEENRLKSENASLQRQMEDLRRKVTDGEERLSELEMIRVQLTKEVKSLAAERLECARGGEDQGLIRALSSQIETLRLENKTLRDRNDELCAEVDSLSRSSRQWRRLSLSRSAPHSLDISAEQAASWRDETEEAGERPGKRRGDSPSLSCTKSDEDSPRVGKLRRKINADCLNRSCDVDSSSDGPCSLSLIPFQDCDTSTNVERIVSHIDVMSRLRKITESLRQMPIVDHSCESCDILRSIFATIQNLTTGYDTSVISLDEPVSIMEKSAISVQTDLNSDSILEMDRLKEELVLTQNRHDDENSRQNNLIKDLEASLEQLKGEYDKSEEYWASKLDEERDAFNDEQKLSDERLTDLITKIAEYEQQFSPRSGLQTIDEKYSLELQVTDLEDEYKAYKREMEKELLEKSEEILKLKEVIKKLEQSSPPNESGTSSPIGYLWNQGTIQTPYLKGEKRHSVRDYQNPAYAQKDMTRCSSDSEKDKLSVNPIQRPVLAQRSSSVGTIPESEAKLPNMIRCSELEGQLRKQHLQTTPVDIQSIGGQCSCSVLEHRCRQLHAALRHQQLYLDSVQQAAHSESATLRARVGGAEAAVARLQQRLTAADLLVKELYLENCQLVHHQQRRLL